MAKVRTVLGDVDASEMGFTMAHEHIFLDPGGHGQPDTEWSLYDFGKALQMMREFKAIGGGCIVEATARRSAGRSVHGMAVVSRESGVHVIASTGFIREAPGDTMAEDTKDMSIDEIADFMVHEITVGMDGTSHKAGWIKGGSEYCYITPAEEKCLRAAARAAMRTGVSVHTHTECGTFGLEQIAIVEEEGMDLTRFGLAHVDRNPDYWYHKKMLEKGVTLIYDGPGKAKYYPDSIRVELLKRLVADGFEHQIMLSNDMGKRTHHTVYGYGPGWQWIKQKFLPRLLEEGFTQETLDNFMIHNPARFYALREPSA